MFNLEFGLEEYHHRLARAQVLMGEWDLDALLVTTQANFRYFTGHTTHRWMQTTAPQFAIIPAKGRPWMLLAAIEHSRASGNPWVEEIRLFRGYSQIGVKELVAAFRDLGLDKGSVGAELGALFRYGMPVSDLDELRRGLPGTEFSDASELFWKLRLVKSAAEIAFIRRAAEVTAAALGDLYEFARPGRTERDLFRAMVRSVMEHGADWPGSIPVASRAPGQTLPQDGHLRLPSDRQIADGDLVWLDAGCIVNGYWCDVMRMFCLGEATKEWRSAYRFVHEALHACIEEARPGAPVSAAVARFEGMLRDSPYAECADRLETARIAHGVGLDLIEPPSMSYADPTILEPGMVLTIEPSIHVPEIGFFMVEEDVAITDSGPEILSVPAPAEIVELGAPTGR